MTSQVEKAMAGKRRKPFCDNINGEDAVEKMCSDGSEAMELSDAYSHMCGCERVGQHCQQCSQFQSLPKKPCDGVSSLQSAPGNINPSDMDDFFAMQCNNNTSAVNLNRMAPLPGQQVSYTESPASDLSLNQASVNDHHMQEVVPSEPRRCLRCISGEPGHIQHILS